MLCIFFIDIVQPSIKTDSWNKNRANKPTSAHKGHLKCHDLLVKQRWQYALSINTISQSTNSLECIFEVFELQGLYFHLIWTGKIADCCWVRICLFLPSEGIGLTRTPLESDSPDLNAITDPPWPAFCHSSHVPPQIPSLPGPGMQQTKPNFQC